MRKNQSRPREFSWPVLPVLDAFVLYDLIETYNGRCDREQPANPIDEAEIRGYADACVRNAEREVLHHLTAFTRDFGQNVSLWQPQYLMRIAKRCPREVFPDGLEVLQNLHMLASQVGVPVARTGAHGLALERWRVLGERAASVVIITHDDFPEEPSEWEEQKWKAYFRRFPQELFSLTILAAVIDLADVEPYMFSEREQWVYKYFLPDHTWHPEHVNWDEYDEFPGDDEEDDEREPWQ